MRSASSSGHRRCLPFAGKEAVGTNYLISKCPSDREIWRAEMRRALAPSWRTAHHSGSRGEKNEEEGRLRSRLRALKNPARGTVYLPELRPKHWTEIHGLCSTDAFSTKCRKRQ